MAHLELTTNKPLYAYLHILKQYPTFNKSQRKRKNQPCFLDGQYKHKLLKHSRFYEPSPCCCHQNCTLCMPLLLRSYFGASISRINIYAALKTTKQVYTDKARD